ncbi:MAG: EamA family transporter RarD, partial [Clostridia bacterium]|nr:EamA family transporter RarD [Clostridia bacterium]
MKNRSFFITMLTYIIWGLLPLYWKLLSHVPAVLTLCCRIIFSLVFTAAVIIITRRLDKFKALLKDKPTMLKLAAASLLITVNWGTYIYAVASGHTLDASLGYYMNPLVVFAASMVIFKEKTSILQIVSICIAASGVIITLLIFGTVPVTALIMAFSFAAYGSVKKFAHVDP